MFGEDFMKLTTTILLVFLLVGCTSTKSSGLGAPVEIRKLSQADQRLFNDIAWGMAGVGFMDQTYFPDFAERKIVKIERIATSDGKSQGIEEWTIQHVGGGDATYIVKIIPDGKGGAYFSTSLKKPNQPPQTTRGKAPRG
jgi:hypothetical protein